MTDAASRMKVADTNACQPEQRAARHEECSCARARSLQDQPLIAHIVFSLDVGGLENGLVNLINHMPRGRYRHAIICLREYTDFRYRICRPDVDLFALHKRKGKDPGVYLRLWRLLRQLRPDIVHTRNYGTLDSLPTAALAGVSRRVHGEHGWDTVDHGANAKYNLLRRGLRPLVKRYVAVSHDLSAWLQARIHVPATNIRAIYNGVDTTAFEPPMGSKRALPSEAGAAFGPDTFIIGTVGRMDAIKDQLTLARAFARLLRAHPELRHKARLVMIGDGPLRDEARAVLAREDVLALSWLPGSRNDISALLQSMDIFVLPSLNEGISNTILEAMASALPVIATRVGGNPELVLDGETGALVPPSDPAAMADALGAYARDPARVISHGRAGRARVEQCFSLDAMVEAYLNLYDDLFSSDKPMVEQCAE